MSSEREKISYFSAMSGVFCGTEIFSRLVRQGPLRSILHALLTVILLGILTSLVQFSAVSRKIDSAAEEFRNFFGDFKLTEKGIAPTLHPEESRYLLPGFGGILCYAPDGTLKLPDKSNFSDYRYIFCWFPGSFAVVMPAGDGSYAVNVFSGDNPAGKQRFCDAGELKKILAKAGKEDAGWNWGDAIRGAVIRPQEAAKALKIMAAAGLFSAFAAEAVFQMFLCQLIFVGFYTLTSRRTRTLKWGELARIALYAGSPALLVAACFAAFDLTEILSFGTVYVIGTIGYFLVIVNKMEQTRRSGSGKQGE